MYIKLGRSLFFILAGIVLSFFVVGSTRASSLTLKASASSPYLTQNSVILGLINQDRSDNSLKALKENLELDNSAAAKCADLGGRRYWGHMTPDGKSFDSFIAEAGYKKFTSLGENLAVGQTSMQEVNQDWLASQSHKNNILNPHFGEFGASICEFSSYRADNSSAFVTVVHFAAR